MALSAADRQAVRTRASGRCEYCRMEEVWEPFYPYHIEHIIARQHAGPDDLENLAYARHQRLQHLLNKLLRLVVLHRRLRAW